ncbi:MAG: hypothetical protein ACOCX8_04445 [Bacteroidota bacterium]
MLTVIHYSIGMHLAIPIDEQMSVYIHSRPQHPDIPLKEHFQTVFSVAEDPSGNWWFGVQDGGISKFEPARQRSGSGSFIHYSTTQGLTDSTQWRW